MQKSHIFRPAIERKIVTIDVACLVLVNDQRRFLTTLRSPHKALGNHWEFPGGKVECDEKPEDALRRELREELHLEVGALEPLPRTTHTYEFAAIQLMPFLSFCQGLPSIHLTEHTAYRWVTMNEAMELQWAPADLPILENLESHFRA